MEVQDERRILGKLPRRCAALVRRIIANPKGERWLTIDGIEGHVLTSHPKTREATNLLVNEALGSVDFPRKTRNWPIVDADTLTANQRRVAEVLAYRAGAYGGGFALPEQAWVRRRWLGLSRPGVIERRVRFEHDGEKKRLPLWQALSLSGLGDRGAFVRDLGLSLPRRLEAFGHFTLGAYGVHATRWQSWVDLDELGEGGKAWARRTADRWVCLFQHDELSSERGPFSSSFRLVLALTLVRTGVRLRPEWDFLLPVLERPLADHRASKECLGALPSERRDAALAAAIGDMLSAGHAVVVGQKFIRAFPSEPLATAMLVQLQKGDGPSRPAMKLLRSVGRRHAGVKRALDVHEGRVPAAVTLSRGKVFAPKSATRLSAVQKRQLVEAGHSWDGKRLTVAERLRKPTAKGHLRDGSAYGSLEYWQILNEQGEVAYDLLRFGPDTGTVFEASTTRVVASIIQHGVECANGPLRLGLMAVLADASKPRRRRAKTPRRRN